MKNLIFLLAAGVGSPAFSQSLGEAPEALAKGPYSDIRTLEYRTDAKVDELVLPDRATELWASITWPGQKSSGSPLLVFLHGNHATCGKGEKPRIDNHCGYTMTGACPEGYAVVPNHAGYKYVADHLASYGFIVVSINANRGVNCAAGFKDDFGLNLARGRLVLKHLSNLYRWSETTQPPQGLRAVTDKILWNKIGLMGHSRGGEGMRGALHYLKNPELLPKPVPLPKNMSIRSLYEIGAVDGQSGRVLNPEDVTWNQLLPMCDGDVSSLQGRMPFDRLLHSTQENDPTQKSLFFVWGANHNFFNTEWQVSDSKGCNGHNAIFPQTNGSPEQQVVAAQSLTSFFISTLLDDPKAKLWARNFNPLFQQPTVLRKITPLQLEFFAAPTHLESLVFENFSKPSGTNSWGFPNQAEGCVVTHKILSSKNSPAGLNNGAEIQWPSVRRTSSGAPYYQMNIAPAGDGWNLSPYAALTFRVSQIKQTTTPLEPVTFSVNLVDAAGRVSSGVISSSFQELKGPVHSQTLFYTYRVPLLQFQGMDLSQIRAVRFSFDHTPRGKLLFADVLISKTLGEGVDGPLPLSRKPFAFVPKSYRSQFQTRVFKHNRFAGIRPISSPTQGPRTYEIELQTADEFPVLNELPILYIGSAQFRQSRVSEDLHTLYFQISERELGLLKTGASINVAYGAEKPAWIFMFGPFQKAVQRK